MKNIAWLLIFSLIAKLILSAWIPLSADESYYWVWSYSPALSYFDHPPFVAWLYWLAHPLENFFSAVRWPGILLGHMTLLIWIQILKPRLSEQALLWFCILALLSPMTGPGSLIITPDTPLLFFWSILVWGLTKTIESPKWYWPLFMGFVLGLGFLSKYTVVIFVPIAIVVFIFQKWPLKRIVQTGFVAFFAFLLSSLPVWLWNINNEWISFQFQLGHGLGAKVWKPSWTIDYVLVQIAFIFPTILFFAFKNRTAPLWLKICAALPIGFFFFTSFRGYAEANWPIVAYLPILALAAGATNNFKWAKWTAVFWAVCLALVLSLVAQFWLPIDKNKIKLKELTLSDSLKEFVIQHENVYARTYQLASKMSFELKRPIPKLRGMNRFDFYDLHDSSQPKGSFWLIALSNDKNPEPILEQFDIAEVVHLDDGFEARRFEIR